MNKNVLDDMFDHVDKLSQETQYKLWHSNDSGAPQPKQRQRQPEDLLNLL